MPVVQEQMSFKRFLSGALVALLFGGAKPFMQILKEGIMGIIHMKFGLVVQEEMFFMAKVYGWTTDKDQSHTIAHIESSAQVS